MKMLAGMLKTPEGANLLRNLGVAKGSDVSCDHLSNFSTSWFHKATPLQAASEAK